MFSYSPTLFPVSYTHLDVYKRQGLNNPTLIVNRLRIDLVKRGEMMNIEDVTEILAVDILGVVPDDETIVIATNKGEPAVSSEESRAGQAYRNIVRRIMGCLLYTSLCCSSLPVS